MQAFMKRQQDDNRDKVINMWDIVVEKVKNQQNRGSGWDMNCQRCRPVFDELLVEKEFETSSPLK